MIQIGRHFKVLLLYFLPFSFAKGQDLKIDTILYKQKVVRHFESLSEGATEVFHLRDNTGYLIFKQDSIYYSSKDKRSAKRYDLKLSYCDIISFEKFNFGGIMPNRIKVITLDKVYQFGTYKRKQAVSIAQKQMSLCKEKPTRKLEKNIEKSQH